MIFIYISEAHADDEWPISNKIKINQSKTIEDRIKIVEKYLNKERKFDIYVDDVSKNNFESNYCGWPERGFVINKRSISHISYGRVNDMVRWGEEIDIWMKTHFLRLEKNKK